MSKLKCIIWPPLQSNRIQVQHSLSLPQPLWLPSPWSVIKLFCSSCTSLIIALNWSQLSQLSQFAASLSWLNCLSDCLWQTHSVVLCCAVLCCLVSSSSPSPSCLPRQSPPPPPPRVPQTALPQTSLGRKSFSHCNMRTVPNRLRMAPSSQLLLMSCIICSTYYVQTYSTTTCPVIRLISAIICLLASKWTWTFLNLVKLCSSMTMYVYHFQSFVVLYSRWYVMF